MNQSGGPVNLDDFCFYAKIFGERNTGTNFVDRLIQENFVACKLHGANRIHGHLRKFAGRVPENERGRFRSAALDLDSARMVYSDFGWKHAVPPHDVIATAPHAKNTLFIAVAKHPVAWLQSLVERPYNPVDDAPSTLSEFIRHEWELTGRDNVPGHTHINVVDLWNLKNAAFRRLEQSAQRSIVIAYEDILHGPEDFLGRVAAHLVRANGEFVWEMDSTKKDDLTFADYRKKYELASICAAVSGADLDYIRSRADEGIMKSFGYGWPE